MDNYGKSIDFGGSINLIVAFCVILGIGNVFYSIGKPMWEYANPFLSKNKIARCGQERLEKVLAYYGDEFK